MLTVFHYLNRIMHEADMMCWLRAYYKNGEDMLELVRCTRS